MPTTLDLTNVIIPDQLAAGLIESWMDWSMRRQKKIGQWSEIRNYVYATDTTTTTN
jgi:hypothetical protein